jgi:hypothetical protein
MIHFWIGYVAGNLDATGTQSNVFGIVSAADVPG